MRPLRVTLLGTGAGMVVGIISLVIAYIGLLLSGIAAVFPLPLVVSALSGGAAGGLICVTLGHLLTTRERALLGVLVSAAVAALIVLSGNYANGSLLPPLIYLTAVINGLMVAVVVGPLCRGGLESGRFNEM